MWRLGITRGQQHGVMPMEIGIHVVKFRPAKADVDTDLRRHEVVMASWHHAWTTA
jgi:hypothetical protein